MASEGVSYLELRAIVAQPDSVDVGDVLSRYHGAVGDRLITVYVRRANDELTVAHIEVRYRR